MTNHQFEACIRQIQDGNTIGLQIIYEAYAYQIYAHILSIHHNRQDAEEITSEVFLKLWSKAGCYHFGGNHKAWLMTIARNMAIDRLRKTSREQLTDSPPDTPISEELETRVEDRSALEQALAVLRPIERQIVTLRVVSCLSYVDISRMLEKPLGTVTWCYQNAIKKLRRFYHDEP